MRVIAVANQKGGCGKTTTSINFAACLAHLQKKVLLVDLDPQGHSTCGLGIQAEKCLFTLYDLLKWGNEREFGLSKVLIEINSHLFVLPAYGILSSIEEELAHLPERHRRLGKILRLPEEQRAHFDFVIIDCPPNLGLLTFNALEACDQIMIPIEPSFFSLHGLAKISETLKKLNQRREKPIEIYALLTLFNSHTRFAKEVYEEVKSHFQSRLFKSIIHDSVILKEAASAGQSIVQYDPKSPAFHDYCNLAVEYLEKEWDRLLPEKKLGWKNVMHDRYGPRRVMGGTLFQFMNKNARGVEIAGDFNQWVPEPLAAKDREGAWQIVLPITSGVFRYKYIVDGEWQVDPYHPEQRQNQFGSFDSYLELN
ncbi:MAG TPA: AAA family ATPase [bacterium]|nr:AAA family ATPase [bacterium]